MEQGKPWFYPTFFRRLRGWVSERGAAAWYSRCCGAGWVFRREAQLHPYSLFTFPSSFYLWGATTPARLKPSPCKGEGGGVAAG